MPFVVFVDQLMQNFSSQHMDVAVSKLVLVLVDDQIMSYWDRRT
jgi:hypothetical protein